MSGMPEWIEPESRCPACGDPIDFCLGHGPLGDPAGASILDRHDGDDHSRCNPDGCDEAGRAESEAENAERDQ
jgi:hypothetical protein